MPFAAARGRMGEEEEEELETRQLAAAWDGGGVFHGGRCSSSGDATGRKASAKKAIGRLFGRCALVVTGAVQ